MKFVYIKFRDWGPFAKVKFELGDGLIGIVGPNGAGKSTVLETLFTATTGQFRKYDNLADFVRDMPGGEKASSGSHEVQFVHGGALITVRRTVGVSRDRDNGYKGSQTAKLMLAPVGDSENIETVTGVKMVDARLKELLGDDIAILGQYAFVQQNEIAAIVDDDPSTRTKAIHRLFGLERFEKTWQLLGEELRGVPELRATEDLLTLRQEREQLGVQHTTAAADKTSAELELAKLNAETAQSDIDRWESAQELRDQITTSEEGVRNAQSYAASQEALRVSAEAEVQRVTAEIDKLQPRFAAARKFLESANEATVALSRKRELLAKAQRIVARVRVLAAPVASTNVWTAEHESELRDKSSKLQVSGEFIRKHSQLVAGSQTLVKCPTCGQDIPDLARAIEQHRAVIADVQPRCEELNEFRRLIDAENLDYERDKAAHEAEFKALQRDGTETQEFYEDVLTRCPSDPEQYSETEQARQRSVIDEHNTLFGSKAASHRSADSAVTVAQTAQAALAEVQQRRTDLQLQLSGLGNDLARLNPAHIEYCRGVIQRASDRRVAVARAEERVRGLDTQLAGLTLRIERAEALQVQIERVNLVRQTLTDARDIFHRSKLPTMLGRRFINAVDHQLQRFLGLMQSDFTAALEQDDDSYAFHCIFADTSEREASSLSGGEKVRFAVSFLLAVNEVLASRLGVLALDEPTAQLDDDNVQHFTGVLSYVQQYAHSAGVQIFLITHSQQLQGSFDQSITLHGRGRVA